MVSAPRCRPGARGLLALLLLLLPLPGARGQCGAPPRLSRAIPYDTSRTEGFPIGAQVTYRCRDGFVKIPGKSEVITCLSNSEWSAFGEFCNAACGAPPRLKSAVLSKEDERKDYLPIGTTVSYVCRPGYESTELRPVITCLENLTWSEAPEFCRGKSCGVPKGPEHGRAVVLTNDLYGARANIICDEGFRLHGRTFIRCLPKGDQVEWSQPPTCQAITCSPPPNIANGMHNGSNVEIFVYNSSVTYKCDHNFLLIGQTSIQCTTKDNINGVWNGSAPECKDRCGPARRRLRVTNGKEVPDRCRDGSVKSPGTCDSPRRLSFAELPGVVNNSYPVGTELKYSCRPGYVLGSGKSPSVICLANSTWSVDPEFCVGIPCKQLELENGRVHLTDHRVGATANFSCNEGYRLIGTTFAQCVAVGNGVNWDKELPHCQAIPCRPPPDITHGSHTGHSEQEFSFGSAVTYKCDQGFSLIGEASIHCTTKDNVNREWSGPAPACKDIITQDKPTTVPPEGAEVSDTSGQCGALPRLSRAIPYDTSHTEGFPIGTEVTYRCLDGFVKIPGKSDTVVCLSNSEWSAFGEFCNGACGAPPRLKFATLSKEDGQKNYCPPGSTVSYDCRPGYESTEVKPVITCLENLTWSEAPEFCRGKSCGVPKGPEHGRAVVITNDLYGARANIICDEGFRLHGRTFIQCLLKGDQVGWSQLPTCQV